MFSDMSSHGLPGQTWKSPNDFLLLRPSTSRLDPIQHTQAPIMNSTSVLGIKYDKGVIIAADTLASYGSMAKFDDIQRLHQIGSHACMGAGGDLSDLQELEHNLDAKIREEEVLGDGHKLSPSQMYEYLGRVMYAKRSKMDPFWLAILVGGWENDQPFLAHVDLLGTTYSSPTIATGYGSMIAQPLLRKAVEGREGKISYEEAQKVIEDCMKVLYYRDARSVNKFQTANITANGVEISKPKSLVTHWSFADGIRGYGADIQ